MKKDRFGRMVSLAIFTPLLAALVLSLFCSRSVSIGIACAIAWYLRRRLFQDAEATLSRQLESAIDAAPVAVVYLDRQERYGFANRYYREHYGRKNYAGRKFGEVLGADAYERLRPAIAKALSGEVANIETAVKRDDGPSLNVNAIFAPTVDSRGNVEGVIIVSEDITARKEAELKLRESQERLAFALQSGRMGTWDLDLEARTVECSREMLELWGVSPEEFHGQRVTLQSKVHPDDLKKMTEAIESAIRNDEIYELEFRILPSAGTAGIKNERWVVSRGRCSRLPGSRKPARFSGVVYDITDRKRKEEALTAAVKARDQFLSIASHELKTPLTSLQLLIQLRQRDLKRKYPEAFSAGRIEAGLREQSELVRRIAQLVDDILDVSRIAEGRLHMQFEPLDLCKTVSEVLGRFKMTAEAAGVDVRLESCATVQGNWDRFRLEQVLLNLLTNALRYGSKKPVHVRVERDGPNALMSVRDEGIGIRLDDQDRIFRRFERAVSENEVSGLGLGLYISKEIVQAHHGEIRLKSEPGKGSEFTVVLPIDACEAS